MSNNSILQYKKRVSLLLRFPKNENDLLVCDSPLSLTNKNNEILGKGERFNDSQWGYKTGQSWLKIEP